MASVNQLTDRLGRVGRGVASFVGGKAKAVANRNPSPKEGMDDNTLKGKVETELFRDETIP